jgi:hypothetical protein
MGIHITLLWGGLGLMLLIVLLMFLFSGTCDAAKSRRKLWHLRSSKTLRTRINVPGPGCFGAVEHRLIALVAA